MFKFEIALPWIPYFCLQFKNVTKDFVQNNITTEDCGKT